MDVVRLGERYTTTYVPDAVVEGYDSFIFTERFPWGGTFEMNTYKIAEHLALLPVDTLISHLGTDDVHMVENHIIELDEFDRPKLKISGSSITSFVNHRHVEGRYQKKRTMARKYTVSTALAVLLWQAFDNNTGKDVTREGDYAWNTKDRVPNVAITESATTDTSEARNRYLVQGSLGPQFEDLLTKGDFGLRVIRPGSGSSGTIITVDHSPIEDRGKVNRTPSTGITALRFDVYDGTDKSATVKFRTLHGDLERVQYLTSTQNYKTAMEIITNISIADQYRNNTQRDYVGLQRRVGSLDVGEPDIPTEPERPKDPRNNATNAEMTAYRQALTDWRDDHADWVVKRDNIVEEFTEDVLKDAERELKDTRIVSVLSGDISPLAAYQFRTDYNLGDKVTLMGDHNQVEVMVVSEYIWSDTKEEGDQGFPGLMLP